jgi:uncharacterized cupredoxin-like copper-binding protein
MTRRLGSLRLLAVIGSVALVAACNQGTASSSPSTASSSPSAASSPSASAAGPSSSGSPAASASESPSASTGSAGSLALVGREYSFEGPTTATAGVTTISLQNAGQEEHQAQLARINDGKTFADLTNALATGDPTNALGLVTLFGGPTAVVPGATVQTTADLTPGTYAFLCFFSAPDGLPHVAKGMISQLQVTGTSSGGALPTGDATVTAKDFAFAVAAPVAPGEHTFTFKNDGPQPHEAGLIKLAPGVTAEQVVEAVKSSGPSASGSPGASASASASASAAAPPFEDAGGIAAVSPGSTATFTVTLEAGASYAFICFVPDPATGAPHAALGMVTAIPTS